MGYLIGLIIWGLIWGFATKSIIKNKNYDENWFWWGFFFGFFALIVALTKPENRSSYTGMRFSNSDSGSSVFQDEGGRKVKSRNEQLLSENGWKCNNCLNVNASYVGTCQCGNTKIGNDTFAQRRYEEEQRRQEEYRTQQEQAQKAEEEKNNSAKESDNLKKIIQYKELLDSGIITQEEFDKKKKELLDL